MNAAILPFATTLARAIVVEQLNPDQWHHVTKGRRVPAGSWESRASGVNDFRTVVADALDLAECTGLPVMVHAYQDTIRPLSRFGTIASLQRHKRRRLTLDKIMQTGGGA